MIDLNQYLDASLDGIPFHITKSSLRIQHSVDEKTYPFGQKSLVTDMGVASDRFELSIFLLGDDVLQRRIQLEAALHRIGPHDLVHPTRGPLTVVVETARDDESMTEFGVADYTVTFVVSHKDLSPRVALDTQANALSAADEAAFAVGNGYDFDMASDIDPEQVDEDQFLSVASTVVRYAKHIDPAAIDGLPMGFAKGALVTGVALAAPAIVGLGFTMAEKVAARFGLSTDGLQGYASLLIDGAGLVWGYVNPKSYARIHNAPPISDGTLVPALSRAGYMSASSDSHNTAGQSNMQKASQALFDAVTITAARNATATTFDNHSQAMTMRDTLCAALSQAAVAETTADPQRQATRRASLRNLRTAVSRDIGERSADLPQLASTTLQAPATVRAASYRLTGTLDEGLGKRNTITHPSFAPSAVPLVYVKGASND